MWEEKSSGERESNLEVNLPGVDLGGGGPQPHSFLVHLLKNSTCNRLSNGMGCVCVWGGGGGGAVALLF